MPEALGTIANTFSSFSRLLHALSDLRFRRWVMVDREVSWLWSTTSCCSRSKPPDWNTLPRSRTRRLDRSRLQARQAEGEASTVAQHG